MYIQPSVLQKENGIKRRRWKKQTRIGGFVHAGVPRTLKQISNKPIKPVPFLFILLFTLVTRVVSVLGALQDKFPAPKGLFISAFFLFLSLSPSLFLQEERDTAAALLLPLVKLPPVRGDRGLQFRSCCSIVGELCQVCPQMPSASLLSKPVASYCCYNYFKTRDQVEGSHVKTLVPTCQGTASQDVKHACR